MKNLFSLLFIVLIGHFAAFSQDLVTQNRSVSNFNEIRVGSGIDLYLKQGNTESLELTAPSDKIGKIITQVRNGVLEIRVESSNWNWGWGGWNNKTSPKVKLTFKDINALKAGGGSDVYSEGRLLFDKIKIDASGGSDVKLDFTAEMVDCDASGGSDAVLTGSSKYFTGNASGGSDLKAKDFRTQSCRINSSGGSDAYVWVENELLANASGGSDIYYYGSPKSVKVHKSGGSDINRR
ncbi:MAG: head GIN domain-containing protein [Bacteroidota bacterium]